MKKTKEELKIIFKKATDKTINLTIKRATHIIMGCSRDKKILSTKYQTYKEAIMLGSIQSDDKCPVCSSRFKHIEPKGLFCPKHPKQQANRFKVRFRIITRRFNNYPAAYQFLTGLRFEEGSNTFDARDYQIKDKPLSFTNLSNEWLAFKKTTVKRGTFNSLNNYINSAQKIWEDTNIKNIKFVHIQDFLTNHKCIKKTKNDPLDPYKCSGKTKKNLSDTLKTFWKWTNHRYEIKAINHWPDIGTYEMEFKNTIDLETQEVIITHIKNNDQFRAWLGIKWLATYIAIRPGEMRNLKECHVDRKRGLLIIPHPKEKRPKVIPLTLDDHAIIRNLPIAFNKNEYFFRHEVKRSGVKLGTRFGCNHFLKVWRRACKALNIEDVQLYGGTKHSTAMGVRKIATFEEVRLMTGHTTNKAFERYFRTEGEALVSLYDKRKALVNNNKGIYKLKASNEY